MKSTNKKIEIRKDIYSFVNKWDFEGDINKVADMIKTIPERLLKSYPDNEELKRAHRFSIRQETDSDYDSEDSYDIYVLECYRWETDAELKNRLELARQEKIASAERAKKAEEEKVKREKALYETLKKKFEKS